MIAFTEDEAKKRIDEELHNIATASAMLEQAKNSIEFVCKQMDWDEDVCYKMGTALESLCGVMALLLTWDDTIPQEETKRK